MLATSFVNEILVARKEFEGRMDDNLDTPHALSTMHELIRDANIEIDAGKADKATMKDIGKFLNDVNKIFDVLELSDKEPAKDDVSLATQREELRKEKKFKEADEIRDTLRQRGFDIEDTPYGPRLKFRAKSLRA